MASSRSVNKIPYEYLSYSQNLRIYDGGIGPRKGYQSVYSSDTGANRGGFSLNGFLYQIEGGNIYKINTSSGTRDNIASLGYDSIVDVLVYQNTTGDFSSIATENVTYSGLDDPANNFYNFNNTAIQLKTFDDGSVLYGQSYANSIDGYALPAIKLLQTGTPTFTVFGTNNGVDVGDGIILTEGQFARSTSSTTSGNFDIQVGRYVTTETAIIGSNGRDLKIFNGETVSTVSIENTGILEFMAGRSWLSNANILRASRPITLLNPEYAYDFTGTGSYEVIYDSNIKSIKSTLSGLYVFTENKVEYISKDATVSGLSIPIGEGGNPVSNQCVVSAGNKIFYLTKKLEIETINYVSGVNDAQVGKLSAQPIVNIREYLKDLDLSQESASGFNNEDDNTVQFFLRTQGYDFNNVCVTYDLVNDTYNIDTGKNFGYVVENNNKYYGFSDITASIYEDSIGSTDNGIPIETKGITQAMSYNTPNQKLFGGFNIAGSISSLSMLDIDIKVDEQDVFNDTVQVDNLLTGGLGGAPTGGVAIGGESFQDITQPFIREADQGRIFIYGDRVQVEFGSDSEIQSWLLDTLGINMEVSGNINIENKF